MEIRIKNNDGTFENLNIKVELYLYVEDYITEDGYINESDFLELCEMYEEEEEEEKKGGEETWTRSDEEWCIFH